MGMFRALIRSAVGRIVELASGDSLYSPGGFRTRAGDTGGGDIYARNQWFPPAGFCYWCDGDGNRLFGVGRVDDSILAVFIENSPIGGGDDPINIYRDGLGGFIVGLPNAQVPTQTPNDNSTKIASTAYVDAAVSGGSIATIRKIAALRAF